MNRGKSISKVKKNKIKKNTEAKQDGFSDLNIITPTLNEEKNIVKLISILTKIFPKCYISVADDGSKDKTQEIVRNFSRKNSHIKLIDRSMQKTKGLTASVVDAVIDSKQDYFVVIDADLQHPPEKILAIYKKLKSGSHLVIGRRKKIKSDWPFHRKLISKTAIWMGNLRLLIVGKNYKDIVSGFFGGRTKLVQKVVTKNVGKFELTGYKVLFDILKYIPSRARVGYVPYVFGVRVEGSSKLSNKQVFSYLRSIFK